VWDPTLGIPVEIVWQGTAAHRLVTIGDSLTHGFASGAVYQTDLSYSAIIADELGWDGLRYPRYGGPGGLPLNLELLMRELDQHFGATLDWWELPMALFRGRQFMDQVEDYWERGAGAVVPEQLATNHVLAVYGWGLRDALDRTAENCAAEIGAPTDDLVHQVVQNYGARAALRVLPRATEADHRRTVFDAAAALGAQMGTQLGTQPGDDPDHGIETLVVFLGANNALGAVTELKVVWSGPGYDDLARKDAFTVWRPSDFIAELAHVVTKVQQIRARHVIWCTVPHVTIAPIARGVASKVAPGSRYFPYYTRPWISDGDFDAGRDPAITEGRRGPSTAPSTSTTTRSPSRSPTPAGRAVTGTCWTSQGYSTGWPAAAIWTTRRRVHPGGGPTRCRLSSRRCPQHRIRDFSPATAPGGAVAGCSRWTASTRPRSGTASSPKR
jgi:hypothetical protein